MNENKNEEIKEAIEKVTGERIDNYLLVGGNNNGLFLQSACGKVTANAIYLAETFKCHPELEQMVKDAKKLQSGELDEQIKEILTKLIKDFGGVRNDE